MKSNFSISVAVAALIFSGCAGLQKGRAPVVDRVYTPINSKTHSVENKELKISYVPSTTQSQLSIMLENKSNQPITIHWDKSAFSIDGKTERAIHLGVKLINRNEPMADSVIPPKGSLEDSITPTSRIEWEEPAGWTYQPICGIPGTTYYHYVGLDPVKEYTFEDASCVGKTFGYMVSYTKGSGKPGFLEFKFKYTGRNVKAAEEP
ncbi:hypothetical protein EBZ37_10270, partial [bacterium]|nr:hypothetical protein [bacterium]